MPGLRPTFPGSADKVTTCSVTPQPEVTPTGREHNSPTLLTAPNVHSLTPLPIFRFMSRRVVDKTSVLSPGYIGKLATTGQTDVADTQSKTMSISEVRRA
nr:hypothetical protein CFP56_31647 [Quercus suber]